MGQTLRAAGTGMGKGTSAGEGAGSRSRMTGWRGMRGARIGNSEISWSRSNSASTCGSSGCERHGRMKRRLCLSRSCAIHAPAPCEARVAAIELRIGRKGVISLVGPGVALALRAAIGRGLLLAAFPVAVFHDDIFIAFAFPLVCHVPLGALIAVAVMIAGRGPCCGPDKRLLLGSPLAWNIIAPIRQGPLAWVAALAWSRAC